MTLSASDHVRSSGQRVSRECLLMSVDSANGLPGFPKQMDKLQAMIEGGLGISGCYHLEGS